MKHVFNLYILFLFCLFQLSVAAQTDSVKNKAQFKIGLFHNSRLNYYGRADSLRSSGTFPLAELWLTRNFYINAAPVFVHNATTGFQYAGTVATTGYQFNDLKKWAGNFYLVKPFYKSNSGLVQSALKTQIAGTLTWQSKIINITSGGDIKFSDKTDIGLTAGADRPVRFQLSNKTVLVIDPSAYLNAGTQQFTQTYYQKNNFLLFPGVGQQVEEDVKKFNLLSYEFSMPVILASGKLQFLFLPAYVIPRNLISIPTRPDLSERGEKMFYATVGVKAVL